MTEKKYKIVEVQPAVVYHCSDLDNRKFYYIQIFEGPPSSQSFRVFDELDQQLPAVTFVKLLFNDVSESYRAVVTYMNGTLKLNIVGVVPWVKTSNGKSSPS